MDVFETEQGPSWQRPNWPVAELDDINLGLDPTEATIEKVAAKAKEAARASGVTDEAAIRRAAQDSVQAMMLIRTYRVRGHLAADLDIHLQSGSLALQQVQQQQQDTQLGRSSLAFPRYGPQ